MGQCIFGLVERLFDYPLKNERKCAYKNDDITQEDDSCSNQVRSNYDELVEEFNRKLLKRRIENHHKINGQSWEERNLLPHFPEWNESNLSYLHSLYLSFCNNDNMLIDFEAFSCIIECLGNECPGEKRKQQFEDIDQNMDGYIEYKEYLQLIYNYSSLIASKEKLPRYACLKIAERTKYLDDSSIGEQLEHGLF